MSAELPWPLLLRHGSTKGLGGKLVGVAQAWEHGGPQAGNNQCAHAAEDRGPNGTPPLRGKAAFKLAQLIGGTDEQGVDGADPAAHLRRRG